MTDIPFIRADRDGAIQWLILDRPGAANAINEAMHGALVTTLAAAAQDASIDAIALAAAGERVFSAGADLKELSQRSDGRSATQAAQHASDLLLRTLLALLDFPKPAVCAVQGKAVGAGAMLALACDQIVAADSASFWFPEIGLGMPSPVSIAMIGARAPALVRRLVQNGEIIDAAQACDAGLIDAIVTHDRLRDEAARRAKASRGGDAFAANKQWIHRDLRRRLIEAAEESARLRRARADGK